MVHEAPVHSHFDLLEFSSPNWSRTLLKGQRCRLNDYWRWTFEKCICQIAQAMNEGRAYKKMICPINGGGRERKREECSRAAVVLSSRLIGINGRAISLSLSLSPSHGSCMGLCWLLLAHCSKLAEVEERECVCNGVCVDQAGSINKHPLVYCLHKSNSSTSRCVVLSACTHVFTNIMTHARAFTNTHTRSIDLSSWVFFLCRTGKKNHFEM